jgi:cytochrome c biogenesis protein CcmG, thiol:disulfide interchange protein DsbE
VKRAFYVIPVVVVLGLMMAFAIFLRQGPPGYLPSQLVGKSAPEFTLPPLDEEAQSFERAELSQGRPTVINFFASWCTPCRVEHPTLQALAARGDITLYGIDYKDIPEKARAFLKELGNPFGKINEDRDGRVAIDFGVTGVPETFVIDGKGVIKAHFAGPINDAVVEGVILPALTAK